MKNHHTEFHRKVVNFKELETMKIFAGTLILLVGLGEIDWANGQDCWKTGCQPNDWAVTGCDQYGRDERGRESCSDGGKPGTIYNCCARGEGGGNGDNGGGGQGFASEDEFNRAVTSNGYPHPSRDHYNNFNQYTSSVGKITSKQEQAMALSHFLHESGGFRKKKEEACESSPCPNQYRCANEPIQAQQEYCNCDHYYPDQYYFGRGYIQLSWCYNYRAASQAIFGDDRLLRQPDLVANDDSIAWRTSFYYWAANVHNAPGVQQGQFGASTKAINGAKECGSAGHPQATARFNIYGKVRQAFGLPGAGDSSGCP